MTRWLVGVLVGVLHASTALAIPVESVPNPREDNGWVTDVAGIIDSATEMRLNELLTAMEAETGVEIAVVTVQGVNTPTPKDFATELFNYWHIGKAGENNGLLVLMVISERRLEMETGYGLESSLTDGWLQSMQQRSMVPAFRAGNYGAGLEAGVVECIQRLTERSRADSAGSPASIAALLDPESDPEAVESGESGAALQALIDDAREGVSSEGASTGPLPTEAGAPSLDTLLEEALDRTGTRRSTQAGFDDLEGFEDDYEDDYTDDYGSAPSPPSPPPWGLILAGLGLLGAGGGFGTWRYKVNRTCPSCKIRLTMLPDDEDDIHWDEGQRTEELIGSIDYQFHHCTQCDFNKVIVKKKWFSSFADCHSCGYRAKTTTTTTLSAATYSSSGIEEVSTHCLHCDARTSHTRVIPQLQEASSSSSSYGGGGGGGGGGSFGGGSSGGGGSGSSW